MKTRREKWRRSTLWIKYYENGNILYEKDYDYYKEYTREGKPTLTKIRKEYGAYYLTTTYDTLTGKTLSEVQEIMGFDGFTTKYYKKGSEIFYYPNGNKKTENNYITKNKEHYSGGQNYDVILSSHKEWFEAGKLKKECTYNEWGTKTSEKNYTEDGTNVVDPQIAAFVNQKNSEAWSQILSKSYTGAIMSCNEGLKIDPKNLYLWGNLAHATLLSSSFSYKEAIEIYKKYMGQNLNDKLSWSDMIKQDFAEFKSKGIESSDMDKALTELGLK